MNRCNACLISCASLGLLLFIVGVIFGFVILPNYVDEEIVRNVRLEIGTEQYLRWKETPVPFSYSLYFFNITNPDGILSGEKPNVREVGPYVYDKNIIKDNVVYCNNTGVLKYNQRTIFKFNVYRTPSNLRQTDIITTLNIPLMAIVQTLEDYKLFRDIINKGHSQAFPGSEPNSPFQRTTIEEYAFKGYTFCSPDQINSFESKVLCALIRVFNAPNLSVNGPSISRDILFSYFGLKNQSVDETWEINSGILDIRELGQLQSWNGKSKHDFWLDEQIEECNVIRGTDALTYKPFNDWGGSLEVYSQDMCRFLTLEYENKINYKGIRGYRSVLRKDTMDRLDKNSCFCIKETRNIKGKKECLPSGFLDMNRCFGIPLIISFPHFLWADGVYANTINGLNPNEEQHITFVEIEPDTGSALRVTRKIQLNMILRNIKGIKCTSGISNGTVIPLVWVDENLEMPDDFVQKLKEDYLNQIQFVYTARWCLIAIGFALIFVCIGYHLISNRV